MITVNLTERGMQTGLFSSIGDAELREIRESRERRNQGRNSDLALKAWCDSLCGRPSQTGDDRLRRWCQVLKEKR